MRPFSLFPMYSTTSIILTSINRTFRLSEHGQKSLTYTTMYKLTSFIRTVAYPNCFVQSQRVQIFEAALYFKFQVNLTEISLISLTNIVYK